MEFEKENSKNQFIEVEKNLTKEVFTENQMIWVNDADENEVKELLKGKGSETTEK